MIFKRYFRKVNLLLGMWGNSEERNPGLGRPGDCFIELGEKQRVIKKKSRICDEFECIIIILEFRL